MKAFTYIYLLQTTNGENIISLKSFSLINALRLIQWQTLSTDELRIQSYGINAISGFSLLSFHFAPWRIQFALSFGSKI